MLEVNLVFRWNLRFQLTDKCSELTLCTSWCMLVGGCTVTKLIFVQQRISYMKTGFQAQLFCSHILLLHLSHKNILTTCEHSENFSEINCLLQLSLEQIICTKAKNAQECLHCWVKPFRVSIIYSPICLTLMAQQRTCNLSYLDASIENLQSMF